MHNLSTDQADWAALDVFLLFMFEVVWGETKHPASVLMWKEAYGIQMLC